MNYKKITKYILFLTALCSIIYLCDKYAHYNPNHSSYAANVAPHVYFEQQLAQEEQEVWHKLASIGITPERFEQEYTKHRPAFLQTDTPSIQKELSINTRTFVEKIIRDNGLNPCDFIITGYNDSSPAAASERVIYINETELAKLPKPAQRFVLSHEMQHIIHKDTARRWVMEVMYDNDQEIEESIKKGKKDHPILQLRRFHEKRADIKAALKTPECAHAYKIFSQEYLKRIGNTAGVTHPTYADRLALAQTIIDYTEQYNQQKNLLTA